MRLRAIACGALIAVLAFASPAAAADTTAPTAPTGLTVQVLADDTADLRIDGETPDLGGATTHRVSVRAEAARSGAAGIASASDGASSYAKWGEGVLPPGTTHAAVRTWVRIDDRGPGESVDLLTVANSDGRHNFDFFVTGDTQRFKWDLYSADAAESDAVVEYGRWYLVEVLVAYDGRRHHAAVRIDGVDQQPIESAGSDVTLASVTIGTHSAKTHAQAYDDLLMRFDDEAVGWIAPGGDTAVRLDWQPSTDTESAIRGYHIWRNGSWYAWAPGDTTTWIDQDPVDGARYSIRAFDEALNRSAWTAWTAPVAVPGAADDVDVTAPPVPTDVRIVTDPAGTATLSWNPVVDAGGSGLREYAIQRNGRWYGWVPAGTTTFVDPAPQEGAVYRVRGIDRALNRSRWSVAVVG